jgi:hypothetical protein
VLVVKYLPEGSPCPRAGYFCDERKWAEDNMAKIEMEAHGAGLSTKEYLDRNWPRSNGAPTLKSWWWVVEETGPEENEFGIISP